MSVERLITDNIDVWTSTVKTKSASGRGSSKKIELYGIKKLRELILELAVRGKLVPQDPNDEPASVLLERIAAEKAQLVKGKKIKKPKELANITEDEKPFTLPKKWEWIRLGEYAQIFSGNAFKSGDFSSEKGVKSIKITNAGVGSLIETDEYLPKDFLSKYNQYSVKKNDLILALTRPYISDGLKISMCPESYHDSLLNQRVAAIRAYVNPEFAFFMLRSPYVLNTYKNRFSGSGLQPNLKMNDVTDLLIPICSEQEQHRIVAKVDELMLLCDQLEQQTETSIEVHQTLVEVLLNTLTLSADAQELMQNWQRISEHFDALFTTEKSIDTLKQTILQLAVMGKLVPQDPNDEPAVKLLERIAEEKAQLIKDKKIKKQKALPEITEDEKPFDLPRGWEWCYLQDVFSIVTDGDHQAPPKADSGVPFLVIGNLNTGNIKFENCKFVPFSYYQKLDWTRQPTKGDLLYTVTGSYGIPILVTENKPFCVQRHVAIMNSTKNTPIEFIRYVLLSRYSFDFATSVATGIAQKTVPLSGLRRMPIPLPPKNEVLVILEKIDVMMSICNQLKARLKESQTTQLHLTDAIIDKAL